jgi:hypothetical protein
VGVVSGSTLPTVVKVRKENSKGIGLSQLGIVGDGFPHGEHQPVAVLTGDGSIHVYQN